jgi:hypothetical protein
VGSHKGGHHPPRTSFGADDAEKLSCYPDEEGARGKA